MSRVSTMSTLKAWSALLAAILVLANTSTALDFLNERPESNYDYPGTQLDNLQPMRPNWTPPRLRPDPDPGFSNPFLRYPLLYGHVVRASSFRPTPKPPGMGRERGDPLSSMYRTLQDGGGGAGGAGAGGGQQVILMHHIHLVYIMSKDTGPEKMVCKMP